MTRSKSRQSLNNVPVPPDDKGGLKVVLLYSIPWNLLHAVGMNKNPYFVVLIRFLSSVNLKIKFNLWCNNNDWMTSEILRQKTAISISQYLTPIPSSPGGAGCQIGSDGLSWLTLWGMAFHPTAWLRFQTMLKLHWMQQWRRIGSLLPCLMERWHQVLPWEAMTSALLGQSRAKTLVRQWFH